MVEQKSGILPIAQELLLRVKLAEPHQNLITQLAESSPESLQSALLGDAEKKAFWINIYNAFTIRLMRVHGKKLTSLAARSSFFNKKLIVIAEQKLSLNDIEHGLLRHSMIWWSLGYLSKWFVSDFEHLMRVDTLDSRIHFALNCGAASCPPIRFYEAQKIDAQLRLATQSFLSTEVQYDAEKNIVQLSEIFRFYIGDFKGKKGIIRFLKEYQVLPETAQVKISYTPYNWDLKLDAFA